MIRMPHVSALSPRGTRPAHSLITRLLTATVAALALLAFSHPVAGAAAVPDKSSRWEFVTSSGGIVPTGAQRQAIAKGALTTAQLSRIVRPSLAITATLGWARSRDLAFAGDNALDILGADLGAELRGVRWTAGRAFTVRPFAAIGAGARQYNSRHLAVDVTNTAAAYLGAGGEVGVRRVRVRLEARDYVTRPGGAGAAGSRNDVALMAGVRWVSR